MIDDSNLKGVLTELRVQQEFLKYGFNVSVPVNPASRYDMIVDINNNLYKVQCKTAHPSDGGFSISLYSTNKLNGRYFKNTYDRSEVDLFATTYNDKVYIIPNTEIANKKVLTLRTTPPINHQTVNINYAENYQFDNLMNNNTYCLPLNL